MKSNILLIALALMIVGCGDGYTEEEEAPTITNVRDYNVSNSSNRVNVFLSMGQSNSVGISTDKVVKNYNVLMLNEKVFNFPSTITFSSFNNLNINKAFPDGFRFTNTTTKFVEKYDKPEPLYVVNIARGGIGLNTGSDTNNHWAIGRDEFDVNSLHPQTIHYLRVLFTQLQAEGLEPYVIGFDWNQWEAERSDLTISEFYEQYKLFFETLTTVICNPTSLNFSYRLKASEGFKLLQNTRGNTVIYFPNELSSNVFRDDMVHYNDETYDAFAQYIYDKLQEKWKR